MEKFICLLFLLFTLGAAVDSTRAQNGKRVPVIVELFTSEGCSTCPPADKYLQNLIKEQPVDGAEIIALSEHVDYWNRFGWIDPFSSAQFSKRQGYYAVFFKRSEVYTPQMVVDGTRELMIKDGNKPISESVKDPKGEVILEIEKEINSTFSITVRIFNLPKIADNDQAVVLLAIIENDLTSKVSLGENSGKKLNHSAVTRLMKNIGGVTNAKTNLFADVTLGKDWKRSDLSIIAFVQETVSRRILGAAKISLKN